MNGNTKDFVPITDPDDPRLKDTPVNPDSGEIPTNLVEPVLAPGDVQPTALAQEEAEPTGPLQGIQGDMVEPVLAPGDVQYEQYAPHLTTFYYPETPEATRAAGLSYAVEGGIHGAGPFSAWDLREHTLEKFRSGDSPFVAVAEAGQPAGRMFKMNIGGKPIIAKTVDTGGGLRPGQVDVATSNPALARRGLERGPEGHNYDAQNAPWPLNAQQASMYIGKDPSQITHSDINRLLQPQIEQQRGLLATTGEPTAASLEAAQDTAEQPSYMQPAEGPSAEEVAQNAADLATGMGTGGGNEDIVPGDMPVPDVTHLGTPKLLRDGTAVWSNGAVQYHPDTDTMEWTVHGRTFLRTGEYGKVTAISPRIMPDRNTGDFWDMTDPRHPVKVELPDHAPKYQVPEGGETPENIKANLAALQRVSPGDAATVKMFSNYLLPINAKGMRINPEFMRLLPYVNAQINDNHGTVNDVIDPREYVKRQTVFNQYADQGNGKPGNIISGFNQALIHLGQLKENADALNLPKTPIEGGLKNWLLRNSGDPRVNEYNVTLNTFSNELARAFKGSAVDQADIDRNLGTLGASAGRDSVNKVITRDLPRLIEGALERQNFGYKRTMREDLPTDELISPEAVRSLDTLGWKDKFAGRAVTQEAQAGEAAKVDPARAAAIDWIDKYNAAAGAGVARKQRTEENIQKVIKMQAGQQ